ncbi:MAG: hypothetical protein IJ410_08580 [Oscillospiraceae bacterium]|nr:hypothetical protein [Oscillospiraceae bacterium]
MKRFISGLVALAAAGAAVGAAGYYLYKKNQKPDEGEELLYTEEMGDEFIIVEDEDPLTEVAETVTEAAEEIADTVAEVYEEVKETIEEME